MRTHALARCVAAHSDERASRQAGRRTRCAGGIRTCVASPPHRVLASLHSSTPSLSPSRNAASDRNGRKTPVVACMNSLAARRCEAVEPPCGGVNAAAGLPDPLASTCAHCDFRKNFHAFEFTRQWRLHDCTAVASMHAILPASRQNQHEKPRTKEERMLLDAPPPPNDTRAHDMVSTFSYMSVSTHAGRAAGSPQRIARGATLRVCGGRLSRDATRAGHTTSTV